ncbi:hypothetical protein AAU61_04405 [Desulfocarbo indianensis]|nr:hypothetical protein AAU61_04405 [Desulfocarbo indianensis]
MPKPKNRNRPIWASWAALFLAAWLLCAWAPAAWAETPRPPAKPPAAPAAPAAKPYHGNVKTKKFHRPGCRYYLCRNCLARFATREEAIRAGYAPCKVCRP